MADSTNVSRRTVVKGAAWTAPAVAVASAAPAFAAASTCSTAERAAIDLAFTSVKNSIVAYWSANTAISDGTGGQGAYLNIHNNSPYDIVTLTDPALFNIYTFYASTVGDPQYPGFSKDSSYGFLSDGGQVIFEDPDGNLRKARKTSWAAGGDSILGAGTGNDNTADIVLFSGGSLVRNPPGAIHCVEMLSFPDIRPEFTSIIEESRQSNPELFQNPEVCQTYYDEKANTAPAILASGPMIDGTTTWNNDGNQLQLDGGNRTWEQGDTICSDELGNYISSTYPPNSVRNALGARFDNAAINGIF